MNQTNNLQSRKEVENWVELSAQEKKIKFGVTLTLYVVTLLATIGLIVGCYYLATTTTTELSLTGQLYQDSNALLMILPLIFGSPLIIAGFMGALAVQHWGKWDDYKHPNPYNLKCDIHEPKTIQEAYTKLYGKHFLRSAVLRGVLNTTQAETLLKLFERYKQQLPNIENYEKLDDNRKKALKNDKGVVQLLTEIDTFENQWKTFKETVFPNIGEN